MLEKAINTIICGEAVKILHKFPPNCIDLTITSPPYDKLRDYHGYNFDFENLARELYRICKEGGVLVWVIGDATIKGIVPPSSFF
ncbi:MAG: DNA methyltransferase [Promethearchaeota archaeon]